MSSSQYFLDGRNSGKTAPAPEKSKFAQTCNLLSQYMKEKGNLRDLNLGINAKLEALGKTETTTTMNLLTSMENSGRVSAPPEKPVDLLPQYSGTGEEATNKAKTAPMTIFYAGQVLVIDDFPTEKAREIMQIASKGTSIADLGGSIASAASQSRPSIPAQDRLRPQINGSDLPIARRASLHRFFEKKKERATARAPYQLHDPSKASPKRDHQHFDLNL